MLKARLGSMTLCSVLYNIGQGVPPGKSCAELYNLESDRLSTESDRILQQGWRNTEISNLEKQVFFLSLNQADSNIWYNASCNSKLKLMFLVICLILGISYKKIHRAIQQMQLDDITLFLACKSWLYLLKK